LAGARDVRVLGGRGVRLSFWSGRLTDPGSDAEGEATPSAQPGAPDAGRAGRDVRVSRSFGSGALGSFDR
jgi:hypothetical protein